MTEDSRDIQEAIQMLAGVSKFRGAIFFIGDVTAVNESDRECTVTAVMGENEITYEGVHLSPERNDGLIQIPAVESSVFCARLANNEVYVLAFSDVTKIIGYIDSTNKFEFSSSGWIWNGGSFGGIAKTGVLETKFNNLEEKINDLIAAITGWTPVPNDGGAALKTALSTWLASSLTPTTQAEISDTKIQH